MKSKKKKLLKIKLKSSKRRKEFSIRKLKPLKRVKKPPKKVVKKKKILNTKIKKNKAFKKKAKLFRKTKKLKRKRPVRAGKLVKKTQRIVFKPLKTKLPKVKRIKFLKRRTNSDLISSLTPKSFFKAKIRVIGIGGGGGSIVSEIGKSLNKATFVIADTDVRAFKKKPGIKYFMFGKDLTHGLGTGLNTDLASRAAEHEKERIKSLFLDQDIVILVACLGGGLGSGSTKVFAQSLKDFKGIIFGIFTLPFRFEGNNKYNIANKALRELRKYLNVSITISNEKIFKIIDPATAITDAFSIVNKSLVDSLEGLIDLIYNPGIINIDFADLRTILKGKGGLAFLNTVETQGKDRVEIISKKILHNPLYQNSNFEVERVLFNIVGDSNLSMLEIDKISRVIAEQNPKAKIIFGISKDSKFKNKIKVTLLMAGESDELKLETAKAGVVKAKKETVLKKTVLRKKKKKQEPLLAPESIEEGKFTVRDRLVTVFSNEAVALEDSKKLSIAELPSPKKAIRRTALEIKEAELTEENKKSKQEEEWEIPAFLRKVKFKP